MCIIVNNVIVKFVEDDIVLSFNMKSAEFYSVNDQWEKAFIDISSNASLNASTNDLHLRKILQLNDVTICLDKIDNKKNSRINFYQDPLIYRCSIQSRFDFVYFNSFQNNVNSSNQNLFNQQLKLIKLNFYCRKLDVSITDQQLPMLLRLIELILAILDGSLITENNKNESSEDEQLVTEPVLTINEPVNKSNDEEKIINDSEQQEGWISWAWSYVPSVSTILPIDDDNPIEQAETDKNLISNPKEIELKMGFYFDELNISFKIIEQLTQLNETTQQRVKSLSASNFIATNAKGIAIEIDNKANNYSHIIFGISFINIKSAGECCCKLSPKPNENEKIFLNAGIEYLEDKIFHYLSGSLFDIPEETISTDQNMLEEEEKEENSSSRDKNGFLDESYGSTRFGAIYLDLLNLPQINENKKDEQQQQQQINDESIETNLNSDVFSFYLLLYKIELNLSANFMHRILKVYESCQSHSYSRPYSSGLSNKQQKQQANITEIDSLAGSYHEQQKINIEKMAKKFEKYLPHLNHSIILKEPVIKIHPYSHFLVTSNTQVSINFN